MIRLSDFAARYGGEEFVITLPETGLDVATRLVKRLCEAIADPVIVNDEGEVIRITASIGVSAFPDHSRSIKGRMKPCMQQRRTGVTGFASPLNAE